MNKNISQIGGDTSIEPAENTTSKRSWADVLIAGSGVAYILLLSSLHFAVEYAGAQDRKANAVVALEAAAAYDEKNHIELALTAEPQSLPMGDLSERGVIRDRHSGVKSPYPTDRGYRNSIRADEAPREVIIDPNSCVWEYVGASADEDHPVQVLAWSNTGEETIMGAIINVVSHDGGVLDQRTGETAYDAARFCNYGSLPVSVVFYTNGGGVEGSNETNGYNQ